ncbi:S8 family serine peptidase [Clostridium formicaceticum]|uniref:Subtilisin DY n=1 Tax=Clostridium formicaceticum TaxID=1497 RepID=A0AAC9RQC4_9CLOT|nr:S8 family serine peptidase [Clostridium formicaceticum]AOY77779.1 hypothetical protein BJL90_19085 [Clostridium formicaceticum]ARE88385.1 Subtilisin DY [Clostridium formicaceticum]
MIFQRKGINILLMTLCVILIITSMPLTGYSITHSDIDSHWAKSVISKWTDQGLVRGYPDGTFKPDKLVSRAEFMTMVNNVFGYKETKDMNYIDVPKGVWYEEVVTKALTAGYISGYPDGTIKPEASITRQEMAAVIVKIKKLENDPAGSSVFADASDIPDWSRGIIGAVVKAGYMRGYPNGYFKPQNNVTRAEAIVALDKAASTIKVTEATEATEARTSHLIFDKAGTYGSETTIEEIKTDVLIKADGVILQNQKIYGDLVIGEEVGKGTVILNNIIVEGNTYIRGGGPDSIIINEGQYRNIIIQNANGKVRVVAKGVKGLDGKAVDLIIVEDAAGNEVILKGKFNSVEIEGSNVIISTQGDTHIGTMTVAKDISGILLNINQGANVKDLILYSKVDVKGTGIIQNKIEAFIKSTSGGGGGGSFNNAPNAPKEPNPSNQTIDVSLSPTLSWTCSDPDGDALIYDVYLGTDQMLVESKDQSVKKAAGQSSTSYSPGTLQEITTYYWRIVARDSKGAEYTGDVWQFTTIITNKDPNQPEEPTPINGAEKVKLLPILSWICSDSDGDELTYDVYLGRDETLVESLDPSVKKKTGYNSTTYLPGELNSLTTYYWRIVAKDNKGGQTAGPLWKFTTKEPEVITDAHGYFKIENQDKTKLIEGYVTHNRGGAGIPGAIVSYPDNIFETSGDILVSIGELAAARIQNVYWKNVTDYAQGGESVVSKIYGGNSVTDYVYGWNKLDYIYEVPVRDLFNPSWGKTPPSIQLEGITSGDMISGTVEFDLSFQAESGILVYFIYLGGEQIYPVEDFGLGGWGENSAKVSIDSSSYPNGPTYIKILAYDYNGNSVVYVLPVIVQNDVNLEQLNPPEQIKRLSLVSDTYGTNLGLHSLPAAQNKTPDNDSQKDMLNAAFITNNVTISNALSWDPVTGADGYKVYRSFDGVNYKQIGTVKGDHYHDVSYELTIGKLTYYKVVPYNSQGDSGEDALIRYAAPLPGFNVILDSPKHGETGVELSPTFSWAVQTIGGSFKDYQLKYNNIDLYQNYTLRLFDATDYLIWEAYLDERDNLSKDENQFKYQLPFDLEPGGIYSWDISSAYYYADHEETESGNSVSISYVGNGQDGSANGENMFTTSINSQGQDNIPQIDFLNFENSQFNKGHVLVKTNDMADLVKNLEFLGSGSLKTWDETGWSMVKVPQDTDVKNFIHQLLKDPSVVIAQPDYLMDSPQPVTVDGGIKLLTQAESGSVNTVMGPEVDVDRLWGLKNIRAEEAWQKTTGSENVILAIIDTGVQMDHPEFADKVFVDPYDATGEETPYTDLNGHGTHVAGIAGDNGRNGELAGVAWDSPIMPIKTMDQAGAIWVSYVVEAISYVAEYVEKNPDKRVVINMSITGRGYNFALKDAIDQALENGVVFVTSAGNFSKRVPGYPAAYNGVIAVAASTPKDTRADFSSTGPWISVAAPGMMIYSTYYGHTYQFQEGTSMASPYVAGAAALLLSEYPELTPAQVKNQLEKTAQGDGFTEELGYGVIDMEAMLGEIQSVEDGTLKVKTNIKETESVTGVGHGVLSVFDKDENLMSYGTTGENGGHIFHYLKPGEYKVVLSYYSPFEAEYQHEVKDVTILSSETTELQIEF